MLIRQTPQDKSNLICVDYKIGVKLQMRSIMPIYIDSIGFYFDNKYKDVIEVVKKQYVKQN